MNIVIFEEGFAVKTQLNSSPEFNNFVIKANNNQPPIEILQKYNPDLVILASNSSTSSLQICSEVRAISFVPILVLSVTNNPDIVEQTLDAGADKFLQKPVPVKVLAAHIKTLTRRAQAEKLAAIAQQTCLNY